LAHQQHRIGPLSLRTIDIRIQAHPIARVHGSSFAANV
jgi:hypothetical protein